MVENVEEKTLIENIVTIKRVVKVVAGGRRFRLSAWVAVGDGEGSVGIGHGKAQETPDALDKAMRKARQAMCKVVVLNGTVPHPVEGRCGAARVLLKPAAPGTGLIACYSVRSVLEAAGYADVLTKSLGSNNMVNLIKATFDALKKLKSPFNVARQRGKTLSQVLRRFMYAELTEGLNQKKEREKTSEEEK